MHDVSEIMHDNKVTENQSAPGGAGSAARVRRDWRRRSAFPSATTSGSIVTPDDDAQRGTCE
jgi:hypothetical protein